MTKLVIHHYLEPAAAPRRARSFARDCGGGCGCRKCREYPRARDAAYTVWKMQRGSSAPIRGGMTRSPGWVIAMYFSSEAEADAYVGRQMRPENYKVTTGEPPSGADSDDPTKSRTALEGPDSSVKFVPALRA